MPPKKGKKGKKGKKDKEKAESAKPPGDEEPTDKEVLLQQE